MKGSLNMGFMETEGQQNHKLMYPMGLIEDREVNTAKVMLASTTQTLAKEI